MSPTIVIVPRALDSLYYTSVGMQSSKVIINKWTCAPFLEISSGMSLVWIWVLSIGSMWLCFEVARQVMHYRKLAEPLVAGVL